MFLEKIFIKISNSYNVSEPTINAPILNKLKSAVLYDISESNSLLVKCYLLEEKKITVCIPTFYRRFTAIIKKKQFYTYLCGLYSIANKILPTFFCV